MATVTLGECWLHDEADRSDFIRLTHADLRVDSERNVERRTYAGGRVRMISTPNRQRSVTFTANAISRADLKKLDGWLGRLLMLRTPSGGEGDEGEVLWGFVRQLPVDLRGAGVHSVPVTFQAITYDQAV